MWAETQLDFPYSVERHRKQRWGLRECGSGSVQVAREGTECHVRHRRKDEGSGL